jgi:peptide chain release factor subunit 1
MVDRIPNVSVADPALIRRLADVEPDGKVLSLYLSLDPSEFASATARQSLVNSVLNNALGQIEKIETEERKTLRDDVELVREFLLTDADWAGDAAGMAVFCSSSRGLFDVVKLPEVVETSAFLDDAPHVLPMAGVVEPSQTDEWCVALINRRGTRIFLGSPSKLRELEPLEDEVPGRHDQGGWSQARYVRAIEEDVEDHLKRSCARLLDLHTQGCFARLVIGATQDLWPRIIGRLHPYVAEKLAARIEVNTQKNVGVAELQAELEGIAAAEEERRERGLLERLREEIGRGGRAAAGLPRVLACLNEARVEVLVVQEGFDAAGILCPRCGWLGESGERCPVDGETVEPAQSIVEKAVERAVGMAAQCERVSPDELKDVGGIAAILRF